MKYSRLFCQDVLWDNRESRENESEVTLEFEMYSCTDFSRTEISFFRVAGMVLCSVFVLKAVLITHGCFSYC